MVDVAVDGLPAWTPSQPRRPCCWWGLDQLPSVGPGQGAGRSITVGAAAVAGLTEVFRQAASSRNHHPPAHAHQCRPIPILRPPPAEDPNHRSSISYLPTARSRRGLILQGGGERIPPRALASIRSPKVAGAVPRWRGWLWLPLAHIELLQQCSNPNPTEQVEPLWLALCARRQGEQVANDYEKGGVSNGDVGTVERSMPKPRKPDGALPLREAGALTAGG